MKPLVEVMKRFREIYMNKLELLQEELSMEKLRLLIVGVLIPTFYSM